MDEAGEKVSLPQQETAKPFYRKWGTKAAEKAEKHLLPDYMKRIWQKNVHLWEISDRERFDEEVSKWVTEIREGGRNGNPGLKALRGNPEHKPHVSIVVPAHNEERYILQALQSISEQKYDKGVEVLIVDNNSNLNDRTAAFAEQCGAKVLKYTVADDDPDKKVSQIALARQKGLEAAGGDIVISTDADVIVPKEWISSITDPLDQDQNITTITGGIVHYDRPEHYLIYGKDIVSRGIRKFQTIYRNKQGPSRKEKSPTYGANMAFRKADALRVHGYNTAKHPGEDSSLGFQLSKIGRIEYIDNEKTRVRVSPRRFDGIGRIGIVKGLLNYRRIYRGRDKVPINKR